MKTMRKLNNACKVLDTTSCRSIMMRNSASACKKMIQNGPRQFHSCAMDMSKTNLLICYGSQTGTAQMFAEGLKSELIEKNPSFLSSVKVVDLSDIEPERALSFGLQQNDLYNIVLFIMSNYGEGQPTDNAKAFYEWLMSENSKSLNLQNSSANCAVFGLGNSANFPERYQAVGKKMEERLKELGCNLQFKRGEGDDGGDAGIETDFENWKNEFIEFLKQKETETSPTTASLCQTPLSETAQMGEGVTTNGKHFFRLLNTNKYRDKLREFVRSYDASLPVSPKNPFPLKVISVKNLCPNSNRKRLEIEFDIENTPIDYETGDHICIFPTNPKSLVSRLEKILRLESPMQEVIFTLETPPCSIELPPFTATRDSPITLYQAMSQFFDLNGVVSPSLLGFLAEKATNPQEKTTLESWKSEKYLGEVKNRMLNIVDMLETFPSIKVSWQDLIGVLPKNQPRYYSVSSSRLENEERKKRGEGKILRITYSPLVQPIDGAKTFFGLCSNFLSECEPSVTCPAVIRTSSFRLPENPETPIVCIAGGTGIAPFRGFIDERRVQKLRNPNIKFGPSILFYGVRGPEEVIYKKEIEQAVKDGLFSEFHIAYSGIDRKMIADSIFENRDMVYQMLSKSKGNLYLCGGVSGFGTRAYNVIKDIIKDIEGVDDRVADSRIDLMRKEGRCFEDLSD